MTRLLKWKNMQVVLSSLMLSLWTGMATAADEPAWPKAAGAVFAFRSADVAAPLIAFDAKGRDLMAFNCMARGRGLFGRFYELVCDGGSFHAKDAGTWVGQQVAKSGAFSFEVMLTPAEAQPKTLGVVFAYGDDKIEDVALLQDKNGLSLRVAGNQAVGLFAPEVGKPVHVLITCEKDKWAAYRDGKLVRSGVLAKSAPAWGTREITMGATWSGADLWRGRLEEIAIFPRALTAEEAAAEAVAVRALQAGRKPATTIRFRGTLLRQARTSQLAEILPYTRSMTAAEYKVEKVLAGKWKQPTIMVLHWMIMDAKRLPIADRKPGVEVELSVEPLGEHPELESCRRDDLEGDVDADVFYCESETEP